MNFQIKEALKKYFKDSFKQINEYELRLPMKYMNNITKVITDLDLKVNINEFPPNIISYLSNFPSIDTKDFSKIDFSKIPEKLNKILYPFQKEGINYAVQKNGKILLGDEMVFLFFLLKGVR
jgi:hypothetical protein